MPVKAKRRERYEREEEDEEDEEDQEEEEEEDKVAEEGAGRKVYSLQRGMN
jgi:hypothetical protein